MCNAEGTVLGKTTQMSGQKFIQKFTMKTTLITGAGRGIGLSIAEKFYKENHKLILLVRDKAQEKIKKKFNKTKLKFFWRFI